ncbi:MAG: DUF1343 domain-containing protein [Planctomycetes bacterium]|nr:DUF1343 domain-containing protein [Planctomycetota bacterium]
MRPPLLVATGLVLAAAGCAGRSSGTYRSGEVAMGLDRLVEEQFRSLRGKRVGVVANPTAVDREMRSLPDLLQEAEEVRLAALFGPEHGLGGAAEAGVQVGDGRDPRTGVPVYSLYGPHRKPTPAMLQGLDVLLYDLQDVGVRAYTYLSTLVGVLEGAAAAGIEVWVLDRPDPLGGELLEGPMLEKERESFVGPHPLPLRYALTAGEFALLVNRERGIGARLRVVPCAGWRRSRRLDPAEGAWVAPSPNLPSPRTALLYAGLVLLEGTNLSEGRGTARPFQLFGAPWLAAEEVAAALNRERLPGARFRAASFVPTFSKYQGEGCRGIEVHVLEPESFRPVLAAVAVIAAVRRRHPQEFRFHPEAFDRLAGTAALREALERGEEARAIARSWEKDLEAFRERRQPFLLYP